MVPEALTAAQRAAVEDPAQYLEIAAGPGTGKTLTLASRIAHVVGARGAAPERVAAVTFTNAAAATLRERLRAILGDDAAAAIMVTTYHGLCRHLVVQHEWKLGLGHGWTVADEFDQAVLARGLGTDLAGLRAVFAAQLYAREARGYGAYELGEAPGPSWKRPRGRPRLSAADADLAVFRRRKRAADLLDYDDLLDLGLQVARLEPPPFDHLFADEFQDASFLQWQLLANLIDQAPEMTLSVVGDTHQQIYGFARGKHEPEVVAAMRRTLPGLARAQLDTNFRSAPAVVRVAEAIVGGPLPRSAREAAEAVEAVAGADSAGAVRAAAAAAAAPAPRLIRYPSPDMLRQHVPALVREALAARPELRPGDVAVLVRTNKEVLDIKAALEQAGLPVDEVFERGLLASPLVQLANTLFKYSLTPVNPHLLGLLKNQLYTVLGTVLLASFAAETANLVAPLRPLLDDAPPRIVRRPERRAALAAFLDLLDATREAVLAAGSAEGMLGAVLPFVERATAMFPPRAAAAAELAGPAERDVLARYLAWVQGQIDAEDLRLAAAGEPPGPTPWAARALQFARTVEAHNPGALGVNVRTVHSVKGEEFAIVLLALNSRFGAERNVSYVAATRARDQLLVLATDPVPPPWNAAGPAVLQSSLFEGALAEARKKYPALYAPLPYRRPVEAVQTKPPTKPPAKAPLAAASSPVAGRREFHTRAKLVPMAQISATVVFRPAGFTSVSRLALSAARFCK